MLRVCPRCGEEKPLTIEYFGLDKSRKGHSGYAGFKRYCKPCHSSTSNASYHKKRLEVLTHYSNGLPKCSCCGEDELMVLDLDHISGGGNIHRREIRSIYGSRFFYWVINNNYPEGFRVLCKNCNWAFRMIGRCYHRT